MPRTKKKKDHFKATVQIPDQYKELWESFIDPDLFLEMALKDSAGIMAWAIARSRTKRIRVPVPDDWLLVIEEWNRLHPDQPRKPKEYIEIGGL